MEIRPQVSGVLHPRDSILPVLWFLFVVSHFNMTPLACQCVPYLGLHGGCQLSAFWVHSHPYLELSTPLLIRSPKMYINARCGQGLY